MKGAVGLLVASAFLVLVSPGLSRASGEEGGHAEMLRPGDLEQGIEFRMENVRMLDALRWLSNQSGKSILSFGVSGSFTFRSPRGAKYTLPEIVGIIDRALRQRGFTLLEREQSFTLVPLE